MNRRTIWILVLALGAASCSAVESTPPTGPGDAETTSSTTPAGKPPVTTTAPAVPPAPPVPEGPFDDEPAESLEALMLSLGTSVDRDAIDRIGESGDVRAAWVLADILRFIQIGPSAESAVAAIEELTGVRLEPGAPGSEWVAATNLLMTWDVAAPPDYLDYKRRVFTLVEPRWEPFFVENAEVDWRLVSWGGVFIDDRPTGDDSLCSRGCIPALDNPAVTAAADGSWYPDSAIVFGVVVNDEARAYPKNMMEIHEMVNDMLGGRRLGIPYCTLCGSAQAYLTDEVPAGIEPPLLRTSGLLIRSNKMMFDLTTYSLIDTFRGTAVSGPLGQAELQLQQVSVITSTWGEWKESHPETTILARDGGIGRAYASDPLGGRDAGGPIFPIGSVDARLPVQTQVVGVETPDGRFVAFPVDQARAALANGENVTLGGVRLVPDGGGFRAELSGGGEVAAHQSFWFAWSQFHPQTLLWSPTFG